ncbi:hypothetical protein [Neorhizobium sp. T7_12]|uniref:hypothetical protein n=1 Tax=Neorhizobium sp. T7_12 TaxID=2093832 RepID=UPI001FE131C5|nr:hypothetical protein [Neorhizobium sp. T7_12]
MRIATGDEDDNIIGDGKDPAAKALRVKGREEARREHDAGAARGDCEEGNSGAVED